MEQMCPVDLAGEHEALRRGWKLGAEDFADRLADRLGPGKRAGVRARESRELDEILAQRLIKAGLAEAGWRREDLRRQPKGHAVKVAIARRLRANTPMQREWIAAHLHMGSPSHPSALLAVDDSKL